MAEDEKMRVAQEAAGAILGWPPAETKITRARGMGRPRRDSDEKVLAVLRKHAGARAAAAVELGMTPQGLGARLRAIEVRAAGADREKRSVKKKSR